MLRTLAALLLLANLLFFVWARGWLAPALPGPQQSQREPERLAAQVRPESVLLLSPQAASAAAAAAATACIEAGPFADADIATAEAALAAAALPAGAWARQTQQPAAPWLVYMGRFADPVQLRAKADELRRLKLGFDEVRAPPDLAPGLALARHDNRAAAEAALQQFNQRGVHTARVVALPPAPPQHWLRVAKADGALRERLSGLRLPGSAPAVFAACGSRN